MKEGVNKCLVSQWSRAHRNPNVPIPIAVSEGRNLVLTFSFRYDPLNPIFSFAAVFSKLLCSTSLFFTGRFPKHSLRVPSLKKDEIVFGSEHWGDPSPLHTICISGVKPNVNCFSSSLSWAQPNWAGWVSSEFPALLNPVFGSFRRWVIHIYNWGASWRASHCTGSWKKTRSAVPCVQSGFLEPQWQPHGSPRSLEKSQIPLWWLLNFSVPHSQCGAGARKSVS